MTVLGPGEGNRLTALGSTYTTKADGRTTAGGYWLVEEEFWGDTTPLHAHASAEEAFYVQSGELIAWVDGTEVVARAGTGEPMSVDGEWEHLRIRGYQRPFHQVVALPVRAGDAVEPAGDDRGGEPGQSAEDHEANDLRPLDVDAGVRGRLRIAAGRVDVVAELRAGEHP